MQVIIKEEIRLRREELFDKIAEGEVFIYPTDTIYGIGCDATNPEAVKKIRDIKERQETPFSVIAPSIEWITENCEIDKKAEEWIEKLPGPYTLILKLKNKNAVAAEVNPNLESVGVRMPDHWITTAVSMFGRPIVTTSVNKTDKPFMTEIDDLDTEIQMHIPFALYEGKKEGRPSKIVHLEKEETEIKER